MTRNSHSLGSGEALSGLATGSLPPSDLVPNSHNVAVIIKPSPANGNPDGVPARDSGISRGAENHGNGHEIVEQPHGTSGETTSVPILDSASPVNKEQVRQRFEMLSGRVKRSKDQYWSNFEAFA